MIFFSKRFLMAGFCALAVTVCGAPEKKNEVKPAWKTDFDSTVKSDKIQVPKGWTLKGKPFVTDAEFSVVKDKEGKNVLRMYADKASGTLLCEVKGVDLNKYPIIRWRWKAIKLPTGGDGRKSDKDDQAIGIYVGTGRFSQDSIAYRWETLPPIGSDGKVTYGGMVSVKWYCLQNDKSPMDKWITEERNIAADFKKVYGYVPEKFAVSVVCNSQYTKSISEAQLAWVEFLPASVVSGKDAKTKKTAGKK
jgi:hypothetical protein